MMSEKLVPALPCPPTNPAPGLESVTAYAPGSIGNVGPGFDILGLAVSGAGGRLETAHVAKDSPEVNREQASIRRMTRKKEDAR